MTPQYQLTDGISPDLVIEGRELILSAQRVVEVTGEAQQSLAAQVGQALHSHLKAVEKERERLVDPAVKFQRIINRLAKEHTGPLVEHKARIANMLADFDKQEQKRVEALKAAQKAEFDKLEAERQVAMTEMKSAPTLSLQIAAEQRANELAQVSRDILLAPAVALRAEGTRVRSGETDYELTDVKAAYAARPELFKDPEPRASIIKSLPLDSNIPGIRLFTKTSVNFTQ